MRASTWVRALRTEQEGRIPARTVYEITDEDRVQDFTARLSRLDHLVERRWPDQTPADDLVLEHARLRLRAELEWAGLVVDQLGKLGGAR